MDPRETTSVGHPGMRTIAALAAAGWTLVIGALWALGVRVGRPGALEAMSRELPSGQWPVAVDGALLGYGAVWILGLGVIVAAAVAAQRRYVRRRQVERELRANEQRLASIFRAAPVGIGVVSHRVLTQVNDRVCEIAGRSREELIGRSARILYPDDREFEWVGTEKYRQIAERGTGTVETRWQRGDGRIIDVLLSSTPLDPGDLETGVTFTALDISERKRAERERAELAVQLLQAQKMEAIGQLAGGVAHDFNNQLAAIQGNADILRELARGHAQLAEPLDQIDAAVRRSADLTSRLLAFARKGKYLTVPVDLHRQVDEVIAILERSIDKRIRIVRDLQARPSTTLGDPTQIENALLNLAVNARDAMPEGGQITFISRVTEVAEASIEQRGLELAPGRYLSLAIADTGCGMDAATRERLFEPFFTTKEPGKGTGLGLASVFGTLKNHRGAVRVASAPGEGSVFETLWPLEAAGTATDQAPSRPAAEAVQPAAAAGLSVLVVDDERGVRDALVRILERLGYRTRSCGDGVEAVQVFERSWREIDVVVLDVMMPRMSGVEALKALRRINPQVRVLLSSGYGLDGESQRLLLLGQVGFLQKPYTIAVVSRALAEITARTSI